MRSTLKALLLVATVGLVAAPIQARADGFVSPWVGTNFGSDIDNGRTAVGVTAGAMGAGIIGGEFDFGYSPSFFGTENDFGHNTVVTAMGNIILGIPVGGTHGAGVRPYVTAGLGLLRTQFDGGTVFDVSSSNNNLGWDAGVGVMGYFSQHFGLRGDLRYFRDTGDNDIDTNNLHFWRASIGVVFR